MDVSALHSSVAPFSAQAGVAPVLQGAETRELIQAVKALNGADTFGPENELLFQKDPQSHQIVIRLIDRKTGEVVSQVPPEYVLRMARDLRRPPR
jgi:uncharacterized FlaG/YvyC family protein